jgi:hypothetical protein
VAVIDILPAMKAVAEREVPYWAKDGHTNSAGHRVIAETVYAALIEKELIPAAGAPRR